MTVLTPTWSCPVKKLITYLNDIHCKGCKIHLLLFLIRECEKSQKNVKNLISKPIIIYCYVCNQNTTLIDEIITLAQTQKQECRQGYLICQHFLKSRICFIYKDLYIMLDHCAYCAYHLFFQEIRNLSITAGGYLNNELRSMVYAVLLGISLDNFLISINNKKISKIVKFKKGGLFQYQADNYLTKKFSLSSSSQDLFPIFPKTSNIIQSNKILPFKLKNESSPITYIDKTDGRNVQIRARSVFEEYLLFLEEALKEQVSPCIISRRNVKEKTTNVKMTFDDAILDLAQTVLKMGNSTETFLVKQNNLEKILDESNICMDSCVQSTCLDTATQFAWDLRRGTLFTNGMKMKEKRKITQYSAVILAACMNRHRNKLYYVQGLHDVCSLLVSIYIIKKKKNKKMKKKLKKAVYLQEQIRNAINCQLCFTVVERLCLFTYLSDILSTEFSLSANTFLLATQVLVLEALPQLMEICKKAAVSTGQTCSLCAMQLLHFTIPWLIACFSHNINDTLVVTRIMDFIIAQPPLSLVYLIATVLVHFENKIGILWNQANMEHHPNDCWVKIYENFKISLLQDMTKVSWPDLDFDKLIVFAIQWQKGEKLNLFQNNNNNNICLERKFLNNKELLYILRIKYNTDFTSFSPVYQYPPPWVKMNSNIKLDFQQVFTRPISTLFSTFVPKKTHWLNKSGRFFNKKKQVKSFPPLYSFTPRFDETPGMGRNGWRLCNFQKNNQSVFSKKNMRITLPLILHEFNIYFSPLQNCDIFLAGRLKLENFLLINIPRLYLFLRKKQIEKLIHHMKLGHFSTTITKKYFQNLSYNTTVNKATRTSVIHLHEYLKSVENSELGTTKWEDTKIKNKIKFIYEFIIFIIICSAMYAFSQNFAIETFI